MPVEFSSNAQLGRAFFLFVRFPGAYHWLTVYVKNVYINFQRF